MNIEQKAKEFAEKAHTGQTRAHTNEPYIVHPAAVVELIRSVPHTEAMLAAGWLHDTVEDTMATLAELESLFGEEVAALVEQTTDISKLSDGNRKVRKQIDLDHTAQATPPAKTIKLADIINNTKNMAEHDPKFAKVYLPEKARQLEVLTEGDATLWAMANEILNGRD